MKIALYLITIIAICAGSYFTYEQMNEFQDLRDKRVQLDGENKNRDESIRVTKKQAKAMEVRRDDARSNLLDAENLCDLANRKLKETEKRIAIEKSEIEAVKKQSKDVLEKAKRIKEAFAEVGIDDLTEVPAYVDKKEKDLKASRKKLEELEALKQSLTKRVARNDARIADITQRAAKRAARLKGNALHGKVTAVNHDWGFVTIKIPAGMPVTDHSELIIQRGNMYIGSLKIQSIEVGRIIADIDYKSMKPGMVVQPGDYVILKNPVTN